MSYKMPPYSKICIAVRDINESVDYYSKAFGWDSWYVTDILDVSDTIYNGSRSGCKLKSALYPNPMDGVNSDFMTIELVQHMEGESPIKDFIEQKGEGIQALQIIVNDMEEALAELEKQNCKKVFYGRWDIGRQQDVAYVDAPLLGGVQYLLKCYDK